MKTRSPPTGEAKRHEMIRRSHPENLRKHFASDLYQGSSFQHARIVTAPWSVHVDLFVPSVACFCLALLSLLLSTGNSQWHHTIGEATEQIVLSVRVKFGDSMSRRT